MTGPDTSVPAALRRRREAALRAEPMACGHRDPLDCLVQPDGPSTYGLTDPELHAHARALHADGWTLDEITTRLDIKPRQSCTCCRIHRTPERNTA